MLNRGFGGAHPPHSPTSPHKPQFLKILNNNKNNSYTFGEIMLKNIKPMKHIKKIKLINLKRLKTRKNRININNLNALKVTGSRKDIQNLPFYEYIAELIETPEIEDLKNFTHHLKTTRFQHSLNVSYYNYKVCKFLGWDYISAARGGLLHDLYFYNTAEYEKLENDNIGHLKNHPQVALKNSDKFHLNRLERDIIAKHMFPFAWTPPKYKETYVIVLVDKFCAILERFGKKK
jgi:uncharacterized protein